MTTIVVFYIGRFLGDDQEEQDETDNMKSSNTIKPIEVKKPEIVITKVNNTYNEYINFINEVFW